MAKETIRSYFGFSSPKHRRGHGSKSLKIVGGTATTVVVVGLIFTLLHRPSVPSTTGGTTSTSTTTAVTSTRGSHGTSSTSSTSLPDTSTTSTTSAGAAGTTTTTTAPPTTEATTVTQTQIPPSQVLVQVINGTGANGQATQAASALHADGFLINGTGDAQSFTYTASVIEYSPGSRGAAQTLQAYVGGASTLKRSSDVPPSEVWLITGSDFTGITGS